MNRFASVNESAADKKAYLEDLSELVRTPIPASGIACVVIVDNCIH